MKKNLLFTACLLGLSGQGIAQTNSNVSGNVNVDGGPGYPGDYSQGAANTAGNVNLKGDLVFTGTNPWILHTPNDNTRPPSLYLAPGSPSNWGNQTRFDSNGDVTFTHNIYVGQRLAVGDVSSPGTLGINNLTLAVGGKLGARSMYVVAPTAPWPDYVFAKAYRLPPLREVAQFVATNHHLPEMPSAAAVQADGLDLGRMDALLLKKVEELTLYLLELKQENEALRARVSKLEN